MQPKFRRKIATDIRDIRSRVEEMSRRRDRYKINNDVAAVPVSSVNTRLMARYEKVTDLVGMDDSRDEIIQILMEGNEASKQQSKIVSIVGFGGLGKTSLANAVYEKLRAQFDCCAFVSVSQTPDMKNLFKCMLNDFGQKFSEKTQDEGQHIKQLREFLQDKRYFIVIDDIWDIMHWKIIKYALPVATRSLQQVRSVVVFPSAISLLPTLRSFRVLRLLDLQGCDLSQGYSLKYVEKLFHLSYLGLGDTRIAQLPEEIGNIRFLQTLDLMGTSICSLPSTIVQLRHLMCLYIESYTRLPNGIGSLTSLEELLFLRIDDDDSIADITDELGQLTGLRVLSIVLFSNWNDKLVECLCKLRKIQNLYIEVRNGRRNIGGLDAWVAPRHLRMLNTRWSCWFSTVQTWVNPLLLPDLSFLSIAVRELEQADLDILGKLPALRYLDLEVDHEDLGILGGFVVGAGSFPCLVRCGFGGFVGPVVFEHGAMPSLKTLHVQFAVREAREIPSSDGGFGMGLGNLPSLQDVWVYLNFEGASNEEVKDLKVVLRHSVEINPNHPRLHIY